MKSWMVLPFALIVGWMMGGWLPKAELRGVRKELATARQALKARAPRRSGFTGVTQMLGIQESETSPGGKDTDAADESDEMSGADKDAEPETVAIAPATNDSAATTSTNRLRRDDSMKRGVEEAMEVWEARSDIARATFVSNVGLDEAQANRFDVLVAAMNIRLAHSIEQFAEQVKAGKQVGEEETIKLVRDLSTSVASTYDALDTAMPQKWRADAGEGFSATDFIDPSVALPLTDIEDELDEGVFRESP